MFTQFSAFNSNELSSKRVLYLGLLLLCSTFIGNIILHNNKTQNQSYLFCFSTKTETINIRKYGIVHLWSDTPCLCPPLKFDHKYIILGQENTEKHQLVFDANTFVVRKTAFWKRLFLTWKRKLRQQQRRHKLRMSKAKKEASEQHHHTQIIDNSRKL